MEEQNRNSEYLVTARKWRPLVFKDIVGQDHVTQTLQNAIETGRVHHAYLFSGPRGVGKTTAARIYARLINCMNPTNHEPCNICASCEPILTNRSLDVIEIDGASNNSVDDIRKLRENAKYPPIHGKYKIYIIDEVHMLSKSAFNALLKTLEEPPPHLLFVFATTEAQKVIPTILSRCQRFDFRRMEIDSIIMQIKHIAEHESINIDDESLFAIATKADGSMRDAQSTFDQVVAFCGTEIKYSELANALHLIDKEFFFRISKLINEKNLEGIFQITSEVVSKGYDLQECLSGLLEHFRNILTVKVTNGSKLIESSNAFIERYILEAEKFSKSDLLRFMNLTAATEQALRYAPQPRIRFELTLLQLASMDSAMQISELLKEIRGIKKNANLLVSDASSSNNDKSSSNKSIVEEVKKKLSNDRKVPNRAITPATEETTQSSINKSINGKTISAENLEAGWEDFLKKYANGKNGLFSLSQDGIVKPKFFNSEIVLQVANSFHLDSFKQKIYDIQDKLSDFYQAVITVKLVEGIEELSDLNASQVQKVNEEGNKSEGNTNIDADKNSIELAKTPIEEAIIQMFDAKELKNI